MTEKTPPRAKFRWKNVLQTLLALFAIFLFWEILTVPFSRAKPNHLRSSCQSNLKQIMLGVGQYVRDYDEKYPLISTSEPAFGWAGAVRPYLKSTPIFQCPSEDNSPASTPPDLSQTGFTDYWFNARVAGKYEFEITDSRRTITLGDGDSDDARYHLLSIPTQWRKDEKSPLYRHLDGANYAFADGHVKWFRYSKWKNGLDSNSSGEPTLRLKPIN